MSGPIPSRPVGPYSPVVRVGKWLVTSGQLGTIPGPDGAPQLVEGGTGAQLAKALENLSAVLATEGATLADVVKATVFLVDMGEFAVVNERWIEAFGNHRPARSAVGVAALPRGGAVEIEVTVALADG